MKKDSFPTWVVKQQRPATTIKKIGDNYYLYYASSVYDPAKKKAKAVQSYLGKITESGVINDRIMINPGKCEVIKLGLLVSDISKDLKKLDVLKTGKAYYLLKSDQRKIDKLIKKGIYENGKIIL